MGRGTQLAVGIILLWFGGFCLFVAFLSGKTSLLTTSGGHGPADASQLASTLASAVQQHEGAASTGAASAAASASAAPTLGGTVGG